MCCILKFYLLHFLIVKGCVRLCWNNCQASKQVSAFYFMQCFLSHHKHQKYEILPRAALSVGYVVEKCEEGSQTWQKVPGIVSGTSHTVRDLEPGKKYKFRVKAENMYGVGEPVETDRAVLAKNPFGKPCDGCVSWLYWFFFFDEQDRGLMRAGVISQKKTQS